VKFLALFSMLILAQAGVQAGADLQTDKPFTICMEDRFWPPGSFFVEGTPRGTQVELVKMVFTELNHPVTFLKMPWKRCLASVAEGDTDAILGAAVRDNRRALFHYPEGATDEHEHPQSIDFMEFRLITRKGTKVADLMAGEDPPQPVGVPLGYVSGETLREQGVEVVEVMNHAGLMDLLRRGRVNSLMLSETLFRFFAVQPENAGKYEMHRVPGRSGPLYLPISKRSHISEKDRLTIWKKIAEIRSRERTMYDIRQKAYKEAARCLEDLPRCD